MIPNLAKTLVVIVGSTILATLAVNAIDMRGHFASSLLGGIFFSMQETQGPCPENMVLVTQALVPFCIDMYEASASDECMYPSPGRDDETQLNLTDSKCTSVSEPKREPWRYVSQHEAQQVCSRSGKRLPTAGEWYKAALGTNDVSGGYTEDTCNVAHNRADGPALTGSGMRCVSDAGVYDMVGNVWEWVDGVVEMGQWNGRGVPASGYVAEVATDGIAYITSDRVQDVFTSDRFWSDRTIIAGIMRGGYYKSASSAGVYATYAASPPSFVGDAVGFRCAVTPTST